MNTPENSPSETPSRKLRSASIAGLIAAGAVVGGVLAATGGASAATSSGSASPSTTSTITTTAPTTTAPTATAPGPTGRSATPVRGDETAVSATIGATLTSKALAAVPGGTVIRIETDAGDATYEAHMTKADGTAVTVKFDASLNVTKVETGMGQGDPAPAGGPGTTGGQAPAGAPSQPATAA